MAGREGKKKGSLNFLLGGRGAPLGFQQTPYKKKKDKRADMKAGGWGERIPLRKRRSMRKKKEGREPT